MRGVMTVLEAVAFLVPDPQALGLIVPTLFGLCRCAVALGIRKPGDLGADLSLCLILGCLVSVALNLPNAAILPAGPNPAAASLPSKRAAVRRAAIPEQRRLA